MNNSGAETIPGSYGVAKTTMPDGTVVDTIVERIKYPDGRVVWTTVEERIHQFDERFKDTETRPNPQAPLTTDALTRDTISEGSQTRMHLSAKLVQVLGDPDRILANKAIDPEKLLHLKRNLSEVSLIRGLCTLAGGKWGRVLSYLPTTGF